MSNFDWVSELYIYIYILTLTQYYKVQFKGKWMNQGKGVAQTSTPRSCS